MPATTAEPAVGAISVPSVRTVVVLPAPFGPRNPNTSPHPTLNETSARAVRSPKRLVRWLTSIAAAAAECPPARPHRPRPVPAAPASPPDRPVPAARPHRPRAPPRSSLTSFPPAAGLPVVRLSYRIVQQRCQTGSVLGMQALLPLCRLPLAACRLPLAACRSPPARPHLDSLIHLFYKLYNRCKHAQGSRETQLGRLVRKGGERCQQCSG